MVTLKRINGVYITNKQAFNTLESALAHIVMCVKPVKRLPVTHLPSDYPFYRAMLKRYRS